MCRISVQTARPVAANWSATAAVTVENAYKINLPQDTTETVIDGGCHAGFGSYGAQKGDGTTTISAEEQQRQTADALAAWMNLQ